MILPIQIPTRLLVEDMGGKPNYCCFSASKFISLAKSTESGWMLREAGRPGRPDADVTAFLHSPPPAPRLQVPWLEIIPTFYIPTFFLARMY